MPNELRDVIGRCLEENPDQRYQAALELKEALLEGTYGRVLRQGGDCPECGFDNPIDVHFCQKCGHDLSALFAECPQCARENRKDVEFCGNCGFSLRELIEDEEEESERVPELATDEIPESARCAIRDHVNKHNGTRGSDTDWWEFSVEFYRMPGHDPVQRTQFEALVDEECRSWKEREAKRLDTEARRAEAVARRDKEAAERRRAAEEARQRVEREKRAKPHKQEAQAAEDASEWAKALASWETVVKIVPEDTTASARLQSAKEHRFEELRKQGEGLHEQGRQSEAVAVWKEALALAPGNSEFAEHIERTEREAAEASQRHEADKLGQEGQCAFDEYRFADAAQSWSEALLRSPENKALQRRRDEAESHAQTIVEAIQAAKDALERKCYAAAIEECQRVLAVHPHHKEALSVQSRARSALPLQRFVMLFGGVPAFTILFGLLAGLGVGVVLSSLELPIPFITGFVLGTAAGLAVFFTDDFVCSFYLLDLVQSLLGWPSGSNSSLKASPKVISMESWRRSLRPYPRL